MKTIAASDVRTDVDAVLDSSQRERVVIYRKGKPCAVLIGIQGYDSEDMELAMSPGFWQMIRDRRAHGKSISLTDVESHLLGAKKSAGRSPSPRKKARH